LPVGFGSLPVYSFVLQYVGYAVYVVLKGVPSPVSLALGIAETPSLVNLFVLGLVAGSLSFGGAYTAIPFIQVEAVLKGAWLPQRVFLDAIAIGNVIPSPLVIFATFVGFQGAHLAGSSLGISFAGAVLITLGMFFPCFLFTIAGHDVLEKLVHNKVILHQALQCRIDSDFVQFLASFFDGLCGSVIGVIAIIACDILKASVEGTGDVTGDVEKVIQVGSAAVIYITALAVLCKFNNKWTALLLVGFGAVAGRFIFV
jgi:chromate transport protein ChrA